MTWFRRFVWFALALAWSAPRAAAAQDSAAASSARALWVRLDLASPGLDAEAVRRAIELELGVVVRLAGDGDQSVDPALSVRTDARGRAWAAARGSGGERVERSIDLPADPVQATESIAWLAGNLARDEAAELIAALRVEPEADPTSSPASAEQKREPEPVPAPAPAPASAVAAAKPASKPAPERRGAGERSADGGVSRDDRRFPFDRLRPVNLTFAHPLALLPDSDERTVLFELGLIYSLVGAIDGVGFNFAMLRTRGPVKGVASSLAFTQTGPVDGVSVSIGGALLERVRGAEVAVGLTIAREDVQGAQASVGANIAGGRVSGAQLAAGANLAGGDVDGVQASVGMNLATARVRGVQVVAGLNLAREVAGAQLGIVNVGKNVKGVQIGLVNLADELDGVSLGLVNLALNARYQALAFANSEGDANLGLKIVNSHVYTLYAGGYRFDGDAGSVEIGIGPRVELGPFSIEPGLHFSHGLGQTSTRDGELERWNDFIYRAALGWEPLRGFELFGGAGLRHPVTEPDPGLSVSYFAGISLFGGRSTPREKNAGR